MNATFALPYESSLGVKPVIVGWCPKCEVVYDPYPGPGRECEMDSDEMPWEYHHRIHKRRMYRCPSEDCDYYYLTLEGFIAHEHGMLV